MTVLACFTYDLLTQNGSSLTDQSLSNSVVLELLLLTGVQQSPGNQGRTDKNLCRCFGAPARRVFPDHLITELKGGPTRTSADVSVPRLAGFSLIT